MHKIFIFIVSIFLMSCTNKKPIKNDSINDIQKLSQVLAVADFKAIEALLIHVKLTENAQNLIHLYSLFENQKNIQFNKELNYLHQFYPQMHEVHQEILNQISKWVYLNNIYQTEVSPSVRLLQKEQLYLAPSHIDFNQCETENSEKKCALGAREKLTPIMSNESINRELISMAKKDPCVNLSKYNQNQTKANLCLLKTQGKSKVELLPLPSFTQKQWLLALEE